METAGFNKKRNTRIAVSLFFFIQGPVFAIWANRIPDIKDIPGLTDTDLVEFCSPYLSDKFPQWCCQNGLSTDSAAEAPANLIPAGYVTCLCTMTLGRFISDWFVTKYGSSKVIAASGLLIFSGLGIAVAVMALRLRFNKH